MNKKELLNILNQHEWEYIEFKAAQTVVSKSVYESVLAFANTEGRHLFFGIEKMALEI
ncbi:AlbA family DNA-binding domain-containing protein [Maridesulfovibrio hydrothermalis]|uniref:Schlafen AlbA-2 domain-containing protein n=1 Tax=Maridesulfovibrio hydrothermalis AM13 = DSM 14728 TaxID=1121451 RepID=L0R9J1_9BACT|nr:protein of unknown function [Maridesulfovibrio hydrothermalis AM13 = DSM 14728]